MEFFIILITLGIYLAFKLVPMRMGVLEKEKEDILDIKKDIDSEIKLLHAEIQAISLWVYGFFSDKVSFDEFIVSFEKCGYMNLDKIRNQKILLEHKKEESKKYTTVKHVELAQEGISLLESILEFRKELLEIQAGFMTGFRDDDENLLEASKNSLVELLKKTECIVKKLGLDVT